MRRRLEAVAADVARLLPAVVKRNALAYFELTPEKNEVAEYYDGRNEDFRSTTLPLFFVVTLAGVAGLALRWRQPAVVLILAVTGYFVATSGNVTDEAIAEYIRGQDGTEPSDGDDKFQVTPS